MKERPTARVLLFDPEGRVLLMKARSPNAPAGRGVWFTVGGGVEPGESVLEAAAREVFEEAGLTAYQVGPVVWLREGVLDWAGFGPRLFKENYVVARCNGGEPVKDGWDETERALVDDIRWWTRDEIAAAQEAIYPRGLAELMVAVSEGRYPDPPLILPW